MHLVVIKMEPAVSFFMFIFSEMDDLRNSAKMKSWCSAENVLTEPISTK